MACYTDDKVENNETNVIDEIDEVINQKIDELLVDSDEHENELSELSNSIHSDDNNENEEYQEIDVI